SAGMNPSPAGSEGRPQAGDVIARSVELGYRVVDDYIRQGRKAAERLGDRSYGAAALGADVQELGTRMMQYAADFMGVWMQLMEIATAGAAARPFPVPSASPPPAAPAATDRVRTDAATDGTPNGTPVSDGTRVRIEVASPWPTEVWLDLRPEAGRGPVVVHALRAADPQVPRLDDVTFANGAADEPPLLRVRIPPSQPRGVYNGLLIDLRTSRPVGTVSVRVSPE
ncbi:MAG: hypothetical protein L0206_15390, partial [Actinobacteria bacterium]|nr:hypothetical protein [Actinomycetota bacterium]